MYVRGGEIMQCFLNVGHLQTTLGNLPSLHTTSSIIYFIFFIDLALVLKNLNLF